VPPSGGWARAGENIIVIEKRGGSTNFLGEGRVWRASIAVDYNGYWESSEFSRDKRGLKCLCEIISIRH
jgi:hypothetical protein